MKDENIKLGKSMLEQVAKSNETSLSGLLKEEWISPILKRVTTTMTQRELDRHQAQFISIENCIKLYDEKGISTVIG